MTNALLDRPTSRQLPLDLSAPGTGGTNAPGVPPDGPATPQAAGARTPKPPKPRASLSWLPSYAALSEDSWLDWFRTATPQAQRHLADLGRQLLGAVLESHHSRATTRAEVCQWCGKEIEARIKSVGLRDPDLLGEGGRARTARYCKAHSDQARTTRFLGLAAALGPMPPPGAQPRKRTMRREEGPDSSSPRGRREQPEDVYEVVRAALAAETPA